MKQRNRRNRWKKYTAAAAGIVGATGASESVNADLIYDVSPDVTLARDSVLYLNVDQDGPGPVFFSPASFAYSDAALFNNAGYPTGPDRVWADFDDETVEWLTNTGPKDLQLVSINSPIGPTSSTWALTSYSYFDGINNQPHTWAGGGSGYVGLRIGTPGNYNYGWINVTYDDAADTLTVHGFAINEVANQPITTAAVPEASSVAACSLALCGVLGARGLVEFRRRVKKQ